jgi:hypothetical protein
LADGQDADHRHLLGDQRQVLRGQEAIGPDGEEERREEQREQGPERRDQPGTRNGGAGIAADLGEAKPG